RYSGNGPIGFAGQEKYPFHHQLYPVARYRQGRLGPAGYLARNTGSLALLPATMIKTLTISHPTGILKGRVQLPASKSEANRALIISALAGEKSELQNLSEANDTQLLQKLLKSDSDTIDAEDAGTVMRFLTAFYAITGQQKTLTGTERMCQRP